MFNQILKTVAGGILGGIILFLIPFLLFKALFFFLFIGLIFRLFAGRRRGYHRWRHYDPYFGGPDSPRFYEGKEGLRDPFYQHPKNI
ncbi:hypothetical protein [Dyadobacter chenhuakuii]|uniref:Uncharacterized protein n=1 Tax=Dyadobacter chenhuakuii TaxID=2909339 RepID=A0A9X1QCH5_9BACT|nr:hypothetical protein [Dyadobacter chenhuakuii]MCF2492149.1 hypothetical protein [Dyadobacter chenhuakuii]MCF2498494.1 hypothetical protein [Dyadobacter chenhuakuii]USJ28695.1 hypothetical protein NFI80_12490 [Dyadobacter chenhuakuii]